MGCTSTRRVAVKYKVTPATKIKPADAKTILFMRHGEAWNNVVKCPLARLESDLDFDDTPLTEQGEKQATHASNKLLELLAELGPLHAILVSTFTRTLQTMRLATMKIRSSNPLLPVIAMDGLRENLHNRRKTRAELQSAFADCVSDWSLVSEQDPGLDEKRRRDWKTKKSGKLYEPDDLVRERQREVSEWLFKKPLYQNVLIVGHSKYGGLLLGRTRGIRVSKGGTEYDVRPLSGMLETVGAINQEKLNNCEIRAFTAHRDPPPMKQYKQFLVIE